MGFVIRPWKVAFGSMLSKNVVFLLGAVVFRLSCAGGCNSNLRCIDFDDGRDRRLAIAGETQRFRLGRNGCSGPPTRTPAL
jgi:hypothetical protein